VTAATGPSQRAWSAVVAQGPGILLALVPGALTVYLGFRSGGFFAGPVAAVAIVLLIVLAGRVMGIARPAEGVTRSVALAGAGIVLLALWTLLSSRWSHAPSRAYVEFDRTLVYALALVVFGSVGMTTRRLRWMVRGLALAALVVCGAGVITRLLPDVWPLVQNQLPPQRLSYPVAYHNTLGLLAATGITICIGLTCDERETRLVRVLTAAATPVLAAALVLSLSRGGVATAVLGVLLFAIVGHPRGLFAGLAAVCAPIAIAVWSTYDADLLVSLNPLTPAAQAQGEHLAAVVALCSVGAGMLRALLVYVVDDVVVELRPSATARRQVLGIAAAALAAVVVAGAVVVDAPGKYRDFVSASASNSSSAESADAALVRQRLTSVTDNGRIRYWRVAIEEFERSAVNGQGAGTYANSWALHRSPPPGPRTRAETVRDAHSLYAEVLGELGLVGFALLLTTLLTILVGVARRVRGTERALYGTIFAAILAWAVAAGFDWHWEMPVVTMWVFALGGAALAGARNRTRATRFLGMVPRSVIAIACLALLALFPLRLLISDNQLQTARIAYQERRCAEVLVSTKQSLDAVGNRPEPRQLAAGCELTAGDARRAISTLRPAVEDDPENWRLHYALAIAKARAGQDPRREIRRARQLNPLEPLVTDASRILERADGRSEWLAASRRRTLRYVAPPL
jgi:hypothetical protein